MTFLYYSLLTLFLVLSFFLVLLVLIQKGRGGGLSAAFGGVGGNTAFGAKTGDVLTWATSIIFGVFVILAIALNLLANRIHAQATALTVAAPTTAPAVAPIVDTSPIAVPPVNPNPTPPPTPTTNPSTKPTADLMSMTPATKLSAPSTQPSH